MNKLHQNIRVLRDLKGLNRDTMAELLKMSSKAYARLEQGKTDIQLSRLEQIAEVLEVEIGKLFDLDKTTILKLSIHHSHTSNYNNQLVNSSYTSPPNFEHELEKARLLLEQKDKLLEQKDKEISCLKEIIELLKRRHRQFQNKTNVDFAHLSPKFTIYNGKCIGNCTVKVLPLPNSLITSICPSIKRQKRSQIANPNPVPPYWRVVELSA